MSSQRDPRALKIRGALPRFTELDACKLPYTFWAGCWLREAACIVPTYRQGERRSSLERAWENKSPWTRGPLWLNLPRILILSRDSSFPKRAKVTEVGQEKLLFDLPWPGRRARRKMRRRVTGPGSNPNTDWVYLLPVRQKVRYTAQQIHSRMPGKFTFSLDLAQTN